MDPQTLTWLMQTAKAGLDVAMGEVRDWRERKADGADDSERPETLLEIPARASEDPNWIVSRVARHGPTGAFRLALVKTSSAIAENVRVFNASMTTSLRLVGDTEWPGTFATMEPVTFVVLDPGFFGETAPVIGIEWDGHDGERRETTFPLPGHFGVWS